MTASTPGDAPAAEALTSLLRIDQRLAPVLAGSGGSAQAAPRIVGAFCESLGWACGTFWSRDADVADRLVCTGAWGIEAPGIAEYLQHTRGRRPILNNAGIVGAAWLTAEPVWVADITQDDTFRRVPIAMRAGLRSALAFPVAAGSQVLGVVEIYSTAIQSRDEPLATGLRLLGGQVAQFLLRVQAQVQVGESEKRFRSLTALSSDWYWEQDAQYRFVRFEGRGVGRSGADLAPAMVGRRAAATGTSTAPSSSGANRSATSKPSTATPKGRWCTSAPTATRCTTPTASSPATAARRATSRSTSRRPSASSTCRRTTNSPACRTGRRCASW
jgi:PAS domain-containing protein